MQDANTAAYLQFYACSQWSAGLYMADEQAYEDSISALAQSPVCWLQGLSHLPVMTKGLMALP